MRLPRLADKTPGMLWNAEFSHQRIAGDDFIDHLQAQLMQFCRNLFQFFDLCQRQFVVSVFTPVRFAVHGVKIKSVLGGFFTPVRAFGDADPFHGDQPPIERDELPDALLRCIADCFATDSPKPPRVMVEVVAGFGAIAVFGTFIVRPGWAAP